MSRPAVVNGFQHGQPMQQHQHLYGPYGGLAGSLQTMQTTQPLHQSPHQFQPLQTLQTIPLQRPSQQRAASASAANTLPRLAHHHNPHNLNLHHHLRQHQPQYHHPQQHQLHHPHHFQSQHPHLQQHQELASLPQQQVVHHPTFSHHHPLSTGHLRRTHSSHAHFQMSDHGYAQPADDSDELQLSNAYADPPKPTGPLVSERMSTTAITAEYADNSDPVFRAKTAALPHKFAYYRTCRGDGHCGWRAIAYSYFESLISLGDHTRFETEEVRLKSMRNLTNAAGLDETTMGFFADDTFDLMAQLAASLRAMDGNAEDILLQRFNEENDSLSIITYFKLLTSAWVQTHPDEFLPYTFEYPDLKSYCQAHLERAECEIDHVAITGLSQAVIAPANLGLVVMYLDGSPGDEINPIVIVESAPGAPTITLLHRPGHYDILYKDASVPSVVPQQPPIQIHMLDYTDDFVALPSAAPSVVTSVMADIPGMLPLGIGQQWPSIGYDFTSSNAQPTQVGHMPLFEPAPAVPAAPAPMASPSFEFVPPVQAGHVHPPSVHSILLEPSSFPMHQSRRATVDHGPAIRHSKWTLEQPVSVSSQLLTAPMRDSPCNTMHFLNGQFQPEIWTPEKDQRPSGRVRHKSTSR
ncbi:cysteine proteinase [Sporormia fimetaria CBS 119925]|uniref:ubiquitinyl hydrolase 1 n=1 Tax=Sporormia fimetaria CBS 119925 TaxID=1340428 RepID=A0A6A6VQ21_9PLEO|nr:cysteine proteinase [Sporormia fimetaria CBS 119925]